MESARDTSSMLFGVALNMTAQPDVEDADMMRSHLGLADMVEALGYDSVFVTEHHFSDYALTPSPIQILTYLAGRTRRILLGTAVVVVPWHHPIRLAEEMLVLDAMSSGRAVFGLGRGSSPDEYAGLAIPASESEARFVDGLTMIVDKFTDVASPPVLRPRKSDTSRIPMYSASITGLCGRLSARLGLGPLLSGQVPLATLQEQVEDYRAATVAAGTAFVTPIVLCLATSRDLRRNAVDVAVRFLEADWRLVDRHYRYTQSRVSATPGYESHRATEALFQDLRIDPELRRRTVTELLDSQAIGDTEQCVDSVAELCSAVGSRHVIFEFGYGGMPLDLVRENMTHFAEAVLPRLRDRLGVHDGVRRSGS